jgi:hypothetical protein
MQIDQSWEHGSTRCIEYPLCARRRDVGLDRLDHAEAHADIALCVELLARIEHGPALHDEIELVVRSHRGPHRKPCGNGCGDCADAE